MRCQVGSTEYLPQTGQRYGLPGVTLMMRQGRIKLRQ
jgi:hypothetical protein